jgi:hypothetical protein
MTDRPLMARANRVWLVDNTTPELPADRRLLRLHELEVQGIADARWRRA